MSNLAGPSSESVQIYVNLMYELRERCDLIESVSANRLQPPLFLYELAQVQIRKVCEVIALSCLCVHDGWDELSTANMRKFWRPPDIMKRIEKLNDNFFPKPAFFEVLNGKVSIRYIKPNDRLSQQELFDYWNRSGDDLHRGNLHRLGKIFNPVADFSNTIEFVRKVQLLLAPSHVVNIQSDERVAVLCEMHSDKAGGKTWARIMDLP